jgi:hypothetical protein
MMKIKIFRLEDPSGDLDSFTHPPSQVAYLRYAA